MGKPKFVLIVFDRGHRREKVTTNLRSASELCKELNERDGIKAHVAARSMHGIREYPSGELDAMNDGMMWCPYCRRWRWFTFPKFTPRAEVGSAEWMLNSMLEQEIRVCAWCRISELDFYVKRANGLSDMSRKRRRNRSRRRKRTH